MIGNTNTVSNSIELPNHKENQIAVMQLYRVMWFGRLDAPNEEVEFQAKLRSCIPSGKFEPGGGCIVPKEITAIIPRKFSDIIINSIIKDLFILAQIGDYGEDGTYLKSVIVLPEPDFFDAVAYVQSHPRKNT